MRAILYRCNFTALAVALAAATLLGSGTGWSDEKTEVGIRLEFWKGHFDRGSQPFHDWDKEKEISAVCARCHGANSLPEYLKEGKNTPAPHVKNGFACTNCHADLLTYARHNVPEVTFPSRVTVDSGNNDSNLCMTCHQGRESTCRPSLSTLLACSQCSASLPRTTHGQSPAQNGFCAASITPPSM